MHQDEFLFQFLESYRDESIISSEPKILSKAECPESKCFLLSCSQYEKFLLAASPYQNSFRSVCTFPILKIRLLIMITKKIKSCFQSQQSKQSSIRNTQKEISWNETIQRPRKSWQVGLQIGLEPNCREDAMFLAKPPANNLHGSA